MRIRKDMHCYILKTLSHPECVGRVVKTVHREPDGMWEITAPWMPLNIFGECWWLIRGDWLRPVNDPDAEISDIETDETRLTDSILAVLAEGA